MTRIPYLQAFANGNKRTSRLAANAPLLAHGLLPFSFSGVNKADYIRGMAAFYELGNMHVIEQTIAHRFHQHGEASNRCAGQDFFERDLKQTATSLRSAQ